MIARPFLRMPQHRIFKIMLKRCVTIAPTSRLSSWAGWVHLARPSVELATKHYFEL